MRWSCVVVPLALASSLASAAPLSNADIATLRGMSDTYVKGWLKNDRKAVMGVMAEDSVFIPHDGVQPRVGWAAIDAFWFPNGKAVGTVPAYSQTITDIKGGDGQATIYGRFDLSWQNDSKRYNWLGNFLIVARQREGRWLFTHMMVSDADPTVKDVGATTP